MRMNLPVTHVERTLKEGEFIVSKTNLKGQITYVNRPFIEISGFTEEKLLGASHNIVRHPDMPPAAFKNPWSTLTAQEATEGGEASRPQSRRGEPARTTTFVRKPAIAKGK